MYHASCFTIPQKIAVIKKRTPSGLLPKRPYDDYRFMSFRASPSTEPKVPSEAEGLGTFGYASEELVVRIRCSIEEEP
jgi:hypothetical protein